MKSFIVLPMYIRHCARINFSFALKRVDPHKLPNNFTHRRFITGAWPKTKLIYISRLIADFQLRDRVSARLPNEMMESARRAIAKQRSDD